jgi:hypothetical protein
MTLENPTLIFTSSYARDLEEIVIFLNGYGIETEVKVAPSKFNPTMSFGKAHDAIELYVPEADYETAHNLLESEGFLMDVTPEEALREMLGGLDDEELAEFIYDEQNAADQIAVAKQLLKDRGKAIDESKIEATREAIAEEIRKPIHVKPVWLVILAFFSVTGTPIAIIICTLIFLFKGTDPKGKSYFLYDARSRAFAAAFLAVALIVTAFFVIYYSNLKHVFFDQFGGNHGKTMLEQHQERNTIRLDPGDIFGLPASTRK